MIHFESTAVVRLILCLCMVDAFSGLALKGKYASGDRQVSYEVFEENHTGPLLILLHGASGPDVQFYREQAKYFSDHGYTVLFLHYFDATRSSTPSDKNYVRWERSVMDLIAETHKNPTWAERKIGLMGFSLGASVVLAAGSQNAPVEAVVDWYGSLPDAYFEQRKGMPPLLILHGRQDPIIPIVNAEQLARLCDIEHYSCESHFYAGDGHGFSGTSLKDADRRTLDFLARKLK